MARERRCQGDEEKAESFVSRGHSQSRPAAGVPRSLVRRLLLSFLLALCVLRQLDEFRLKMLHQLFFSHLEIETNARFY